MRHFCSALSPPPPLVQLAWSRALVDRLVNRTTAARTATAPPSTINTNSNNSTTRKGLGGGVSSGGGGDGGVSGRDDNQEGTKAKSEAEKARAMWEKRLVFLSGGNEGDLAALFQASDVVLDAFPASGYVTSLQVFYS
jgi:hypothetical protein